MNQKKLLLGVCGGIACYKAIEIVRQCKKNDFSVKVILTKAAQKFVTPLTFQSVSQQKVALSLFDLDEEFNIGHIQLAQNYPLFLIAPASANMIAKMATGLADDLLSTVFLASNAKIYVAPAMNNLMWQNIVVQENIAKLKSRGVIIIPPESGYLACDSIGPGRLAAIDKIVQQILSGDHLNQPLKGKKILITLGGTIQPIDPFRFIGNAASGKMGFELALQLINLGAETTIIAALTKDIPPLIADKVINVKTSLEMEKAFFSQAKNQDIIIKTAAVSDYQSDYSSIKIKQANFSLNFSKSTDILAKFGENKPDNVFLVGFSAETENLIKNSQQKLINKNLDMIVANKIEPTESVLGSDYNKATLLGKDFRIDLPKMTKAALASKIINKIIELNK